MSYELKECCQVHIHKLISTKIKYHIYIPRFLKGEVCRKELSVHDPGQDQDTLEELVLNFFPNLEENLDLLLGTLRMSKDIVFLRRRGERQRGLLVST